jgi:phospholipid/cholesterol/gamma-HCH transport system substrate-binding protein
MNRLRHTEELVGFLVLAAILVLLGAMLQAGLLGRWFQPTSTLRIVLPGTGGGGLAKGAEIEVLGTHAGTIRRIVINPSQGMYAEAEIDDQIRDVIPRNSTALIRRRFGIAGAAYVEIKRGSGPPMNWSYALMDATTERAATDNVSALIDEMREKIFPILTDAGRAMHSVAAMLEGVERGEGNIGRAFVDQTLMRNTEAVLAGVGEAVKSLDRLLVRLQDVAADAGTLVKSVGDGKTGVPGFLRQVDRILADFRPAMRDFGKAATRAPAISRNVEETSQNLPAVLVQTQMTAQQLEKLLQQLRGHWLLGGGGDSASPESRRLAPTQARP